MFERIEIGIKDIFGRDIREGDRIRVKHINYMQTPKEYVDEEFIAVVKYHPFQAMFKYFTEEGEEDDDNHVCGMCFNHRSSSFEVLGEATRESSRESPREDKGRDS